MATLQNSRSRRQKPRALAPAELRQARQALGLTQAALAEALGIAATTVARWERAESPVANPQLVRLALERLQTTARTRKVGHARRKSGLTNSTTDAREGRPPHHVPIPATPFIGREEESAQVSQLLRAHRLVTLTGPGGVGKTRLALRVASELQDEFQHGAVFVPLASISDDRLVMSRIAQTLAVRPVGGHVSLPVLLDVLADRHLLLILDNFEHVLAAATLVAELLATCPAVKVLATSRAVLKITGEHVFVVPPMRLLEDDPRVTLESGSEAVQLFVERASAAAGFDLSNDSLRAVAEICRRLDGLPLAIELAAARVRGFSPHAILTRLEPRLDLLVDGPRDAPERHRTMRAAIAWSYDLLPQDEQRLFRQLAVFAGGWTLEAVTAICVPPGAGPDPLDARTLQMLTSLADKALIQTDRHYAAEPRFRMLETIREYALEQLRAAGEEPCLPERHAAYYAAFASGLGTEERTWGADGPRCPDLLENDQDNLRAAMRWAIDAHKPQLAMQLANAQWHLWFLRGHFAEGRRWLNEVLSMPEAQAPTSLRAGLLYSSAVQSTRLGDFLRAIALNQQVLALGRELGDRSWTAIALQGLGAALEQSGDLDAATPLQQESLALFRALGRGLREALGINNLAWIACQQCDFASATMYATRALMAARKHGAWWPAALCQRTLGYAAQGLGQMNEARRHFKQGLDAARQHGDNWAVADLLEGLGKVAMDNGRHHEAHMHFGEALRLRQRIGDRLGTARSLEAAAAVAALAHDGGRALALRDSADALRAILPARRTPREARWLDTWLARASAAGTSRAHGPLAKDRSLALERAVALATETFATDAVSDDTGLTSREREIASLVASGLANLEIAHVLVITERTVENHMSRILRKLKLRSRTQLAAWALQNRVSVHAGVSAGADVEC